jgi:hypothetical protein
MKSFLIWLCAVVLTLSAVVYQRLTGPTNPKRVEFSMDGTDYNCKFPRSMETLVTLDEASSASFVFSNKTFFDVPIKPTPEDISLKIMYRRYPGEGELEVSLATYNDGKYRLSLPSQPPAGKIIYYPVFEKGENSIIIESDSGIITRFKSPVPSSLLIPHVILMFIAMLMSNFTGLAALLSDKKVIKHALLVIILIGIGGLILGPMVQKFAFGEYWTGWPFGGDLTDNKTLVAFLFWVTAWFFNRKQSRRYLYIIAAAVMLLVYCIPHSTAGSQYDYEKGSVVTGRR